MLRASAKGLALHCERFLTPRSFCTAKTQAHPAARCKAAASSVLSQLPLPPCARGPCCSVHHYSHLTFTVFLLLLLRRHPAWPFARQLLCRTLERKPCAASRRVRLGQNQEQEDGEYQLGQQGLVGCGVGWGPKGHRCGDEIALKLFRHSCMKEHTLILSKSF